jgi:hypothetical protein
MRIKNPPVIYIDVYSDSRIKVLYPAGNPNSTIDRFRLNAIGAIIKKNQETFVKDLEPGRYQVIAKEYYWIRRQTELDIIPV